MPHKQRMQLVFLLIIVAAITLVLLHSLLIDSSQKSISFNIDCKSWKRTSRHKTTLITRTACTRHYTLLILVSSAPGHFNRRNLIRQTWGSDSAIKSQWKTFFVIGQTQNQIHSALLFKENEVYGGIIRANYLEDYWNQTLKIEMAFEWAARYCNFSFLLKTDDDVFVSPKDLIALLQASSTHKHHLYLGNVNVDAKVHRGGKFKVTYTEYSESTYPSYCSGAGFVLSYDVVECFVALFDVDNPFRIDDVYVGMLAHKAGIKPTNHYWFRVPASSYEDCYYVPQILLQHQVLGDCLVKLYQMHSQDFFGANLGSYF